MDLSEDAGVSLAMATVFSVQGRIPYLLCHGIVHLIGFDHENDQDWLLMTEKEDEVLKELIRTFPDLNTPAVDACEVNRDINKAKNQLGQHKMA